MLHGRYLLLLALVTSLPPAAFAQAPFETTGTRALGMAGAFVGVADDSSATYWNPAGLATLRVFDASLERSRMDHEEIDSRSGGTGTAWTTGNTRLAIALPVLAFTYERVRMNETRSPATAGLVPDRQDPRIEAVARAFQVQHFGLTLVQSLGDAIVVGGTLRLVRAGADGRDLEAGTAVGAGIQVAEALDPGARSRFDADVGVLASFGRLRLGLVARNLTEPEFDLPSRDSWRLERHVRIGASIGGEPVRGQRPWAAAVDADLTTTAMPEGDRRSLAAGTERWWSNRRFAVRAGARIQTVGDLRPAVSGGLSVAVRTGLFIEGQATGGADDGDQGWSVGARVAF